MEEYNYYKNHLVNQNYELIFIKDVYITSNGIKETLEEAISEIKEKLIHVFPKYGISKEDFETINKTTKKIVLHDTIFTVNSNVYVFQGTFKDPLNNKSKSIDKNCPNLQNVLDYDTYKKHFVCENKFVKIMSSTYDNIIKHTDGMLKHNKLSISKNEYVDRTILRNQEDGIITADEVLMEYLKNKQIVEEYKYTESLISTNGKNLEPVISVIKDADMYNFELKYYYKQDLCFICYITVQNNESFLSIINFNCEAMTKNYILNRVCSKFLLYSIKMLHLFYPEIIHYQIFRPTINVNIDLFYKFNKLFLLFKSFGFNEHFAGTKLEKVEMFKTDKYIKFKNCTYVDEFLSENTVKYIIIVHKTLENTTYLSFKKNEEGFFPMNIKENENCVINPNLRTVFMKYFKEEVSNDNELITHDVEYQTTSSTFI